MSIGWWTEIETTRHPRGTPPLNAARAIMPKLTRRSVLAASAAALVLPARARSAYPAGPIKVVVPFGPGGLADVTMRIVAERLSAIIGQQVVVINQPGANGVTAARAVLSAEADGHTLALLTNGTAVAAALSRQLAFDPAVDFVPVSSLGFFDFLVLTAPSTGFRSLSDVLAAARKEPGRLNFGTIALGSTQHLTGVLLKRLADVDIVGVVLRTTPDVLTALVRGDVHIAIDGYVGAKPLLDEGKLLALATTGARRSAYLPSVPSAHEAGLPGLEVTSWNALFTKTGTDPKIVARLNEAILQALAEPGVKARLLDLGIEARGGTPNQIGARLAADISKWSEVVERAGIQKQ